MSVGKCMNLIQTDTVRPARNDAVYLLTKPGLSAT